MSPLSKLSKLYWAARERLRTVFRRRSAEADMDEELRFHLEMEAEKITRADGTSREEARRRAGDHRAGPLRTASAASALSFATSPLRGAGRLAWSAAQCETGRGDDLSTRTLLDVEKPSPHLQHGNRI